LYVPGGSMEAIDCHQSYFTLMGDRAAVRAATPGRFAIPGNGPVTLLVTTNSCKSAAIGNSSVVFAPSFLMASISVQNTTRENATNEAYLLEFSTSWDALQVRFKEMTIAGEHIDVTETTTPIATTTTVAGSGTKYSFQNTPNLSGQTTQLGTMTTLYAGKQGDTELSYTQPDEMGDRAFTACVPTISQGPLTAYFPSPSSCLVQKFLTGWSLQLLASR